MKGAQSFRAASLRPASVALSRARRSKPDHAELVRSTYTLPSVQGVKTGDLVPSEARPGVVSSSVVRIALRVPSRENHGDLPSQQRAMSDLGTPGGTRSIPNASEHHARARATRDHAASRPVSSRTRPRRAKAGARAFPETTTDIARPSVSRLARAGPATNGATSSLANLSLRPGGVSGTGASHARRAMPSPRRRSTARHSRAPRARPRPLAHPFPTLPEKKQNTLAPRPQARPSRRSGWEGSPAPSAARTPKPRHERYVARFPSSTAAGRSFGDGSRFARRPLFSFRFFRLFQRARASRVSTANRPVPTLDARLD